MKGFNEFIKKDENKALRDLFNNLSVEDGVMLEIKFFEFQSIKPVEKWDIPDVSHLLPSNEEIQEHITVNCTVDFKGDDIIINGYNEVWKVLTSNKQQFVCRRLSDNKVDSVTREHFTLHKP